MNVHGLVLDLKSKSSEVAFFVRMDSFPELAAAQKKDVVLVYPPESSLDTNPVSASRLAHSASSCFASSLVLLRTKKIPEPLLILAAGAAGVLLHSLKH